MVIGLVFGSDSMDMLSDMSDLNYPKNKGAMDVNIRKIVDMTMMIFQIISRLIFFPNTFIYVIISTII
jgi:hypothetical protein